MSHNFALCFASSCPKLDFSFETTSTSLIGMFSVFIFFLMSSKKRPDLGLLSTMRQYIVVQVMEWVREEYWITVFVKFCWSLLEG